MRSILATAYGLLADGDEPPREFRIFSAGVNQTEKGAFTFDEAAAVKVMSFYVDKGVDLSLDYEHQALSGLRGPPVKAPAAGWYELSLRGGELWATNVRWTPAASAHLRAKEYRYFSPAFETDDEGRIARLVNVALTNLPAMDRIEPLVAANTSTGGSQMNELEQAKAEIATLKSENTALKAQVSAGESAKSTVVSLSTVVGLADAAPDKVRAEIVALTSLRTEVRKLTGKDDDASAVGALQGFKVASEELGTVKASIEKTRIEQLTSEFTGLLDQASRDGKIAPAPTANHARERGYWDALAKDKGIGDALVQLKAFLPAFGVVALSAITSPTGTLGTSEAGQEISGRLGIDEGAFQKWRAEQVAAGRMQA